MTTRADQSGVNGSGANGGVVNGSGVYRPEMVASYLGRPRGRGRGTFEPDRLRPRWRWAAVAIAVIGATVLAGLVVRVPAGPVATVVGLDGLLVVLAIPSAETPARDDVVELETSGEGVLRARVRDSQQTSPSALMVMALVELEQSPPAGSLAINGRVRLRAGTTPFLVDVLKGGE